MVILRFGHTDVFYDTDTNKLSILEAKVLDENDPIEVNVDALDEKTTINDNDFVLIADSQDSNANKKVLNNNFTDPLIKSGGKPGGQTIVGGTGPGDKLIIQSTSDSSRGFVQLSSGDRLNMENIPEPDKPSLNTGDWFFSESPGRTNTVQLYHFNNVSNPQVFINDADTPGSPFVGGANSPNQVSTSRRFGEGGCFFVASNQEYLELDTPISSDVTGDFVLDLWINPLSFDTDMPIYTAGDGTGNNLIDLHISMSGDVHLEIIQSGIEKINTRTGSNPVILNLWQHVAIERYGDTFTIFIDGIPYGSGTFAGGGPVQSLSDQHVGSSLPLGTNDYFDGYMDEFRFIPGAQYEARPFSVPFSPYGVSIPCCKGDEGTTYILPGPNTASVSQIHTSLREIADLYGIVERIVKYSTNFQGYFDDVSDLVSTTGNLTDFWAINEITNTIWVWSGSAWIDTTVEASVTNSIDQDIQNTLILGDGKSGGQSITGGTGGAENLTLSSTTNASKGQVIVNENTVANLENEGALVVSGGVSSADKYVTSQGVRFKQITGLQPPEGYMDIYCAESPGNDANTVVLFRFNDTANPTNYQNEGQAAPPQTFTGYPLLDPPLMVSDNPKFGSGSLKCEASKQQYIDFDPPLPITEISVDLTFDFWVYINDLSADRPVISTGNNIGTYYVEMIVTSSGNFRVTFVQNSVTIMNLVSPGSVIVTDQWTHVAMEMQSGTATIFINGVNNGSAAYVLPLINLDFSQIGTNLSAGGTDYFDGFIDELRNSFLVSRFGNTDFEPPVIGYGVPSPFVTVGDGTVISLLGGSGGAPGEGTGTIIWTKQGDTASYTVGPVVIGSSLASDDNVCFEVTASDCGILLPRLSTAQRDAIPTPAESLLLYNSDLGNLNIYNTSEAAWKKLEQTWERNATLLFHQSGEVVIGNNSADASAILDIVSTTKGVLVPRMTTTERDNISSPATGLIIYNTTTDRLNFYNGSSWEYLTQTWNISNSHIFYDTGTVCIGGNMSDSSALLHLTSTDKGVLLPRLTTTQRDAVDTPKQGLVLYNTTTNNLNQYDGSAWERIFFSWDKSGTTLFHSSGEVAVGASSADGSAILDLTSTTKGILIPRMTTTERNNIGSPATGLQVYNTTTNEINFYNGTAWEAVLETWGSNNGDVFYQNGSVIIGGTAADSTSVLDIRSTTKGMLTPRMTTTQRNAISSPGTGLTLYDTVTNLLQYNNGSSWIELFKTWDLNGTNIFYNGGSIGIGTNTPVASALFELTSTSQGVLFPRMSTGQRDAIGSPATGLTIYNTTLDSINVYNGSAWIILDQTWLKNNGDLFFNTGSIGIGTSSPNAAAVLDITSTTKGLLLPRMTTAQRDAISSPVEGLVIYNTTTNDINEYTGSQWEEVLFTWDRNGTLLFHDTGEVVVGASTINASAILELVSTTKGFLPPRLTTTQRDNIGSPAAGLFVYNTSDNELNYYNGTTWLVAGSNWEISGSDIYYDTGSVAIGATSVNSMAIFELVSTTKGFIPPKMTTTQRNAIALPPNGLILYNTTLQALEQYNGTVWEKLIFTWDKTTTTLFHSSGEVAIGASSADGSAILDLTSTTKGLLVPRMTEVQRNAIGTPAESLTIYNTDEEKLNIYDSTASAWANISKVFTSVVSTTDSTVTTIATIAVPTDTTVYFDFKVLGRRTGGTAGTGGGNGPIGGANLYHHETVVRNVSDVLTISGDTTIAEIDDNSYAINVTFSGTDFLIQVIGKTNHDVDWKIYYNYEFL